MQMFLFHVLWSTSSLLFWSCLDVPFVFKSCCLVPLPRRTLHVGVFVCIEVDQLYYCSWVLRCLHVWFSDVLLVSTRRLRRTEARELLLKLSRLLSAMVRWSLSLNCCYNIDCLSIVFSLSSPSSSMGCSSANIRSTITAATLLVP